MAGQGYIDDGTNILLTMARILGVVHVLLWASSMTTTTSAFAPVGSKSFVKSTTTSSSSQLFNVPPPAADDVVGVKKAADRESPPQSFYELQINCARAAKLAIKDGYKLIEVEVRLSSNARQVNIGSCSHKFLSPGGSFLPCPQVCWK